MEGGQIARGSAYSDTDILSVVLDARKPVNSFVKLLTQRHQTGANARALRKRAADELYELPDTSTPYGTVTQKTTIVGSKGSFEWYHINMFAFFYLLAVESAGFFELVKLCVSRANGGCLGLSVYSDEVVPRNKLRPDMGGKYQAVYFQVLDFPAFIRSRLPLRWFTFGYASARALDEAGAGPEHLFKAVLHSFFGQVWNLQTTGVRLRHGIETVHMYCRYVCSPQDERAHKFCFGLKGSSGRNPCCSCENVMGRVPFFEDDSGFCHVLSPQYEKLRPRTSESAREVLDHLAWASTHKSKAELDELEMATGIAFDSTGLLYDAEIKQHIRFPECVYWDWMHNWCASGGVGQFHLNQLILVVLNALGMDISELDDFASKVTLPKSYARLPKKFFKDRIVKGTDHHIRCFASELLVAVDVMGLFLQLVLKPVGILKEHVACFDAMQTLFAIFKRSRSEDIPTAHELTRKHHVMYSKLYGDCLKPKLHYCKHVVDCWQRFGILLSCFGAESNHRFSMDIFSFSYRNPCMTALAFDVRRLFQAAKDSKSFQHTFLTGTVVDCDEAAEFGEWGNVNVIASSMGLATPCGHLSQGDLVEWHVGASQRLGICKVFAEVRKRSGEAMWVAIVDELGHRIGGVWASVHTTVVGSSLIVTALPFVQEDEFVRPLYAAA